MPDRKTMTVAFIVIGIGLLCVGGIGVAAIPCGPLKAYHAEKKFNPIQQHIEAADDSLQSNIPVASYLIAQLKSDLRILQTENLPGCFRPIAKPLECSINNMLVYADHWSQESGNPVPENARKKYQACMVDYFVEMSNIK
jgi:hypothetical protein